MDVERESAKLNNPQRSSNLRCSIPFSSVCFTFSFVLNIQISLFFSFVAREEKEKLVYVLRLL